MLRLLPIVLIACALFAVAPEATATCAGVGSGGTCIGVYTDCSLTACPKDPYVCAGLHDGTDCTGVQKP